MPPKDNNSISISWLKLLLLSLAVRIHKGREEGKSVDQAEGAMEASFMLES